MATVEDVLLPDIGDFSEVEVIEILVAPGDRIEPEQSLLTLESDKASMEIPSPIAGTVQSVKVAVGDKISQGSLLATVETDVGHADAVAPAEAAPTDDASPQAEPPSAPQATPSPAPAPSAAPKRLQPPRQPRSRCVCRISATSPISRSSRSWSAPATASMSISPY